MFTAIITSTIQVNSLQTVLTDHTVRKKQYLESIIFYLRTDLVSEIIVCDNSGYDYSLHNELADIAAQKNKRIEFLCFEGNKEFIQKKGKGYGEGEILLYILAHSKLLKGKTNFLKITGRVQVINIDAVLAKVKKGHSYFQRVGINPFRKMDKVDTRFYVTNFEVFEQYLKSAYTTVNDGLGYYLEHAYYDTLCKASIQFYQFKVLPRFEGISGSTGKTYTKSNVRWFIDRIIYKISYLIKLT